MSNIISTSEEEKRMLTFGAILFYYRGESILDINLKGDNEEYVKGLQNQWGISNKEEAIETLQKLLELERSSEFDLHLKESDDEVNLIKQEIAKELKISSAEIEKIESVYAWDICRLVSLSKWCYWCEYITVDEMWDFISHGTDKAAKIGENWQEYTISFLLGRTIHGFDLEDVIDECKELFHSKKSILSRVFFTKNLDVYKKYRFKM